MTSKKNICIGYLSNNVPKCKRLYTFRPFIDFLNKTKNVSNFFLLLLINPAKNNDENYMIDVLKKYGKNVNYESIKFDNNNNYILKIKYLINYSLKNNFDYCLKLDNDIIINNYILDYMYNNLYVLDNDKNLFISPSLSSGIPTCEYFINKFMNKHDKRKIHNIFLKTKFPENLWGYNYNFLNKYTLKSDKWDFKRFSKSLNNCNYHYKGLHPIRLSEEAHEFLNNFIVKNKHKIYSKQDYKMVITNDFSYLCNSIFIIKAKNYKKITDIKELYVDIFDEVPINKFIKKHNLNVAFVDNSFTIHPYYNSVSNHLKREENLFKRIFNN